MSTTATNFNHAKLREPGAIPAFLLPVCEKAAGLARLAKQDLESLLITEYGPGAAIGWHEHRSIYAIGTSLLSPCSFAFARRPARVGNERPSFSHRVRPIFCAAPHAMSGSIAVPPWIICAIH